MAYFVDGVHRSWTVTPEPLLTGTSVELGAFENAYIIPPGKNIIKVIADDQNVIAESDDNNNVFSQTLFAP